MKGEMFMFIRVSRKELYTTHAAHVKVLLGMGKHKNKKARSKQQMCSIHKFVLFF
jgi:hypothetical protein